jgi:hypothetical protein
MDALPPTPPLLAGWLSKRRDYLPVQAWRPRWCVLDVRAGTLTYYEKRPADGDAGAKPRGVIALPPGTSVAITDAGRAGKPGTPGRVRADGGRVLCESPGGGFWPFEVAVPADGASGTGSPNVAAAGRPAGGGSFSGGASPAVASGSGTPTVYRLAATLSADERGAWVTALRVAADPAAAAAVGGSGGRPGSVGKSGSGGHKHGHHHGGPVPLLRPSLQQSPPPSQLVPVVLQAAPSPAPTAASTTSTTATGSSGGSGGGGGSMLGGSVPTGRLYSDAASDATAETATEAAARLLPGRELSQASVFTASSPHSGSVSIASGAATERELSTTSFGSFAGFAPPSGGGNGSGSGSTPLAVAPPHRSASSSALAPLAEGDEPVTSRPQSFSSSSSSSSAAAAAPAAAVAVASPRGVPLPSPAPKPAPSPAPPPMLPAAPAAPLFVPPPPPPAPYSLAVLEDKIAQLKRLSFSDDGWRPTGTTSGVACFAPTDGGSGCKGVGYIPFPRKAISFVLSDNEFKRRTDAQFHSGRQLQSTPEGQTTVSYWRFFGKVGVSGRDFVNLSHWRFEPDGTLIHVAWSVPHPDAPPVEGVVRANAIIGGWIMTPRLPQPASGGGGAAPRDPTVQSEPGCDTIYCMRSDLAGSIPAFITRQVIAQQAALVATTRDAMAVDFGPRGVYGPGKLAELRAVRATNINSEWEAARQTQHAQQAQEPPREAAAAATDVATAPAPASPALSPKPSLLPTSATAAAAVSSPLAARVRTPKAAPASLSLSASSSAAPSAAASVVSSPALAPLPPPAAAAVAASLDGDADSVAGRPNQRRRKGVPEGDGAPGAAAPAPAAVSSQSSGSSTPALKPRSPSGAAVLGEAPQPASGATSPQPDSSALAMAGGLQHQLGVMLLAVLAYALLQLLFASGGSGGGGAASPAPAS